MKVLLVDNSPAMGGSIVDGIGLVNQLTKLGDDVSIVASRTDLFRPLLDEKVERFDIPVPGFRDVFEPLMGMSGRKIPVLSLAIALRRFSRKIRPEIESILNNQRPDIVHVHNFNLPHLPVLRAAKQHNLPVIIYAQMIRSFSRRERQLALIPDRVVCVSQAVRACHIQSFSLDPDRVKVVHAGIDLSKFSKNTDRSFRTQCGLSDDIPAACMLGRVTSWKGQDVAIAAWKIVCERIPDAVLLIVGEGDEDYLAECRKRAQKLGITERVLFLGHHPDVVGAISASDLVVHASCYSEPKQGPVEALGLVVIEAMAAGLPVVATAAGGPVEIVEDDVTGKLVPPGDAERMAEAILYYLQHAEEARIAGQKGRKRAEEMFSETKMAREMRLVYQDVLGKID